MAVNLYFGLPGSGKTSLMAKFAKKALKSKRYKYVYSNTEMNLDGLIRITVSDLGKFSIHDGLVLIDEATIGMSNRAHKDLPKELINWFLLHRHYNVDVYLFTQRWDGVDKTIRVITDRVYYVYKGIFTGWFKTKYYRVPYDIIIPDPKDGNGEKLGEIVQGYCKPGIFERIFCGSCFRPFYYKYFDSWEAPALPELPSNRVFRVTNKEISDQKKETEEPEILKLLKA